MERSRKSVLGIGEHGGQPCWETIGTAFVDEEGSLNIKLVRTPPYGAMKIRDYQEPEREKAAS